MSDASIRTMRLDELKAAPYNPRRINERQLAGLTESLKRFGLVQPIIWNSRTGHVVGGHQRVRALKKLGEESAVVVVVDLPDTEERALNVALNSPHIAGEFTEELGPMLAGLIEADAELFAALNLDDLLEVPDVKPPPVEDDDPDLEPSPEPVTKPGDIWTLGRHRVMCGDSTNAEDVARLMAGARAALALTSPPYASQRKYDESSGFVPISPDCYVEWFEKVQACAASVLEAGGSWVVNIKAHSEDAQRSLYVMDLVLAHVRAWGWRFVDEFVWVHSGLPSTWPNKFKNQFEPCFHFSREREIKFRPDAVRVESNKSFEYTGRLKPCATGNPISFSGSDVQYIDGTALPGNVLRISVSSSGAKHEAAFPVALPSFFVRALTDEGDAVYEPFCGSGTTLIAAEQLNRTCYGMEISPAYCDVIVRRWEALTGGAGVRE